MDKLCLEFECLEYAADDKFQKGKYTILQSDEFYTVKRNDLEYLKLPREGYILLKTKLCGVCSTDLNRRYLPFPLPQITGHEILAESLDKSKNYVVEISDSCISHNESNAEIFCKSGLKSHCPNRMVLGINKLLGGFSPYILSPFNSAINYNRDLIPDMSAVFVEPFAAALNAIYTSPPLNGDSVAVIGPKKLGALVIIGLYAYRIKMNLSFTITAIVRREDLITFCYKLGADNVIVVDNKHSSIDSNEREFDIVYDCSGTESGFKKAMQLAKREVHLKSTNGQKMCGLSNLTAMVVDEISIMKLDEKIIDNLFIHDDQDRLALILNDDNNNVGPIVKEKLRDIKNLKFISENIKNITDSNFFEKIVTSSDSPCRLPRFDFCIAKNIEEIDFIIRPFANSDASLVKPHGLIIVSSNEMEEKDLNKNEILKFINQGGCIRTSRCGDFNLALKYLEEDTIGKVRYEITPKLNLMVTHVLPIDKIEEAFDLAKLKDVIKVIVYHQ